jgi:hypothetical protein
MLSNRRTVLVQRDVLFARSPTFQSDSIDIRIPPLIGLIHAR